MKCGLNVVRMSLSFKLFLCNFNQYTETVFFDFYQTKKGLWFNQLASSAAYDKQFAL